MEFMASQTRYEFFGTNNTNFTSQKLITVKKLEKSIIRYAENKFFV